MPKPRGQRSKLLIIVIYHCEGADALWDDVIWRVTRAVGAWIPDLGRSTRARKLISPKNEHPRSWERNSR
jgi:hypothetical protein